MEPVVAMVLRMESVYLIESATSTPAAREEVAALAYEVSLMLRVCGGHRAGGGVRTAQCADGGARDRNAAPSDEGVGGVVIDEDGQVDGGAPEGELEVAVPHLGEWGKG